MDLLNLLPPDPVALLLPAASAAPPRLCSPDMRDFLRSASFRLLRTYTASAATAWSPLRAHATAATVAILGIFCAIVGNAAAQQTAANTRCIC